MKRLIIVLILIPMTLQAKIKTCSWDKKQVAREMPLSPINLSGPESEAYQALFHSLCHNLKVPNHFYRGFRSHPGPPYKAAYLWDTAFISQVWMYWDTGIAQELLKYLFRFQKKNGMVKHAVLEILVKPYPYSNSQPPLLAWAAWRIYERSKDKAFLSEIYPKLVKYQDWLRRERRNQEGLYFWKHPYESGIDNSPRFSNTDGRSGFRKNANKNDFE